MLWLWKVLLAIFATVWIGALVAMFVVYLQDKRAIERLAREYGARTSSERGGELTDG